MSCNFKQPAFPHSIAGQRAYQNRVLSTVANAILPRAISPGDATEHYGILSQNGAAPRPRRFSFAFLTQRHLTHGYWQIYTTY